MGEVDLSQCKAERQLLPEIVWLSDAKAAVRQTDADYRAFDRDVVASKDVADAWKQNWASHLAAFNKFRDDALSSWFFGAVGIVQQNERYICALKQYRASFASVGGKVTSVEPLGPGAVPASNDPLKGLGTIVVGTAVVAVALTAMRYAPAAKRAFTSRQ